MLRGAVSQRKSRPISSAAAFADLARSGALRLNARDLPRDLVADDPNLAEAKLRSVLIAPPAALTNAVIGAFDVVRGHPIAEFSPAAIAGRMPSHLEREVEGPALARADAAP